eukprot:TRINITY_DN9380_c0_g1_i1.p1 TRINITY_DN9380_c0_g1~~TRINITY_DN9380_c0_g1_i1.p1  ORF type:complete len:411 (+),score=53.71 TRINITY_DN9380_c0_g1_i1:76-1308(+)
MHGAARAVGAVVLAAVISAEVDECGRDVLARASNCSAGCPENECFAARCEGKSPSGDTQCVLCESRIKPCAGLKPFSSCSAEMTCRQRGVCPNGKHYEINYSLGCADDSFLRVCGGDGRIDCVKRLNEGRVTLTTDESLMLDTMIPLNELPTYEATVRKDLNAALAPLTVTILSAYFSTIPTRLHVAFRVNPTFARGDVPALQDSVNGIFSAGANVFEATNNQVFATKQRKVQFIMDTSASESYAPELRAQDGSEDTGSSGVSAVVIALSIVCGVIVVLVIVSAVLYYRHTHQANSAVIRPSGGRMTDLGRAGFGGGIMAPPGAEDEDERIRRERKERAKQRKERGVEGATKERERRNDAAAEAKSNPKAQASMTPAEPPVTVGGPLEDDAAQEFALELSDGNPSPRADV